MANATATKSAPIRDLKDLTRLIQRAPGFPEVLAALKNGRGATIDGAWGSAAPLASAALGLHAASCLLIVVAHVGDLDDFAEDVATFSGAVRRSCRPWTGCRDRPPHPIPRTTRRLASVIPRRVDRPADAGPEAIRPGRPAPLCRRANGGPDAAGAATGGAGEGVADDARRRGGRGRG